MDQSVLKFFAPLKPGEMMKTSARISLFPFDVSTIMETQRRNLKAWSQAQQLMIESLQVVAQRQGAMLSDLAEEQAHLTREAIQTGKPEDKVAEQTLIMQSFYERLVDHLREINDMVSQSSQETADVIHSRVGASMEEMRTAIRKAKDRRAA
jgi:phasin family protein